MLSRIALAAVSVVSLASFASAGTPVFMGNGAHNPNQGFSISNERVEVVRPYTLTGSEASRLNNPSNARSVQIGNRTVLPAGQR